MTTDPTTPVDLDRLDALLLSATTPSDSNGFCRGCGKIDTRCECMDLIADAYPALSAELRALRAEVERLSAPDYSDAWRQLIQDKYEVKMRKLRAENGRLRAVRDAAEAMRSSGFTVYGDVMQLLTYRFNALAAALDAAAGGA